MEKQIVATEKARVLWALLAGRGRKLCLRPVSWACAAPRSWADIEARPARPRNLTVLEAGG
jgi:hypothetical protein